MSSNIKRNKLRIDMLCAVYGSSSDRDIKDKALYDLIEVCHGINNSLAITQQILEEATEHCEELQDRLDKGY